MSGALMKLCGRLGGFGRDPRGSAAILAGLFGLCLVCSLSIAVDAANVYLARRTQQGALDLAALAAARDIANAEQAARASLAGNGLAAPQALKITLGHYEANHGAEPALRFVADVKPLNAVRLEMTNDAKLHFGRALLGGNLPKLSTRSVAVSTRLAAFTIGSRLASLNGGVANAVLSKLLGASLSLTAMDYDALAAAEVDMPDFLTALAPKVGASAGTYDSVLATDPTVGQIAEALGGVSSVSSSARSALAQVAGAGSSRTVSLGRMISFGPFGDVAVGKSTGLVASVSALDLLATAIGVANGGRQVDIELAGQVPGLTKVSASVTIGERPQSSPWIALGAESAVVRTAQTRVRLLTEIGGPLGLPALRLPVAADVAAGEARLTFARCGANPRADAKATLAVTPSVAELWVGEPSDIAAWNDVARPATVGPAVVLNALLLTATASAHVAATNMQPKSVTFDAADIAGRVKKTVATTDIAQSTLASLTRDLSVSVRLNPLGLVLGAPAAVSATLSRTLSPLGALLDPPLSSVLKLLGVGLGEADVSVKGLRCDGSALVG